MLITKVRDLNDKKVCIIIFTTNNPSNFELAYKLTLFVSLS